MVKFLNTASISEWILRIITEATKEIVMIVPYVQVSEKIFEALTITNTKKIEITIIYRENKVNDEEKLKLLSLENLNLMCHPNIHAKCYFNEKYLIIASMNLYEYSQKNNREMGILISRAESSDMYSTKQIFSDAIVEINEIMNGANLEKGSINTINNGLSLNLIKTEKEVCEEKCKLLNKHFVYKKFITNQIGNEFIPFCKNYFDKIDIFMNNRIEIILNYESSKTQIIFNNFKRIYNEFMIEGFKIYWNSSETKIFLYHNTKAKNWEVLDEYETSLENKKGIDKSIELIISCEKMQLFN